MLVLHHSGSSLMCLQDPGTAHDHERAAMGDKIPGTAHGEANPSPQCKPAVTSNMGLSAFLCPKSPSLTTEVGKESSP